MAPLNRSQPYRLKWPLTPTQVEGIDEMFQILFKKVGTLVQSSGTTESGVTGSVGPMGPPGLAGTDGLDGDPFMSQTGPQGGTGLTGAQGPTGLPYIAEDGLEGDPFPPIQGPQGNPGPTGAQGPQGAPGLLPETDTAGGSSDIFLLQQSGQQSLQTVTTIESTLYTTTGSFADVTALSVSITPSAVANRIRIIASLAVYLGNGLSDVSFKVLRGSTTVKQYDDAAFNNNTSQTGCCVVLDCIDSPASTSSLTYKIQAKHTNGATNINQLINGGSNVYSSITVQEII